MSILQNSVCKIYKDHQKKQCFLKDPKSDIFVILKDRIFPFHKIIIEQCLYFQNNHFDKQKVLIINQQFDIYAFERIMGCLYGYPLQYLRNSQIFKILEIIMFFDIKQLKTHFQKDFDQNFEQYGVILLYEISRKYHIEWLEIKCLKDLVSDKFEQFYIKKFDLMNSDQQIFQQLLKQHQIMKSKGIIQGLQEKSIKSMIQQYGSLNSTLVDAEDVMSLSAQDEVEAQKIMPFFKSQKKTKIRKRNSTWGCVSGKFQEIKPSKTRQIRKLHSQNANNLPQKQKQIENLHSINNRLFKSYGLMFDQIRQAEIKSKITDASSNFNKLQNIGKSLEEIQTIFQQQKSKIGKAKQIIKQMSLEI